MHNQEPEVPAIDSHENIEDYIGGPVEDDYDEELVVEEGE